MSGHGNCAMRPLRRSISRVSLPRHNGGKLRQQTPPWEEFGISRATWYRYGKPTEKAEFEEAKSERRSGTLADSFPDFKKMGFPSVRTYQRAMRVMQSELWPFVQAECLSIATAEKILGNRDALRHVRERIARNRAEMEHPAPTTPTPK